MQNQTRPSRAHSDRPWSAHTLAETQTVACAAKSVKFPNRADKSVSRSAALLGNCEVQCARRGDEKPDETTRVGHWPTVNPRASSLVFGRSVAQREPSFGRHTASGSLAASACCLCVTSGVGVCANLKYKKLRNKRTRDKEGTRQEKEWPDRSIIIFFLFAIAIALSLVRPSLLQGHTRGIGWRAKVLARWSALTRHCPSGQRVCSCCCQFVTLPTNSSQTNPTSERAERR